MPYTLAPDPKGKYIVAKVTGDTTRHNAYDHVLAIHQLGRELGIRCFLVDVTESRNVETLVDNYEFASEDVATSPDIDPEACIAMLVAPHDHSHDFVQALTQAAGIDHTMFRDRDAAIAHLLAAAERLGPRPD